MSVLSDGTLKAMIESGKIGIDPYDETRVQAASIDICLGHEFRVMRNDSVPYIDVREPVESMMELVRKEDDEPFVLHPGEFALGTTLERVRVPRDLVCRLEGKSSLGRLGLVIHSTAGWIDPGFEGPITLEMSNDATVAIALYPRMPVGQFTFMHMDMAVQKPYNGKYQHQDGPMASQMHQNFGESQEINPDDLEVGRERYELGADHWTQTSIKHKPTGIVVKSERHESQLKADQEAMQALREVLAKR